MSGGSTAPHDHPESRIFFVAVINADHREFLYRDIRATSFEEAARMGAERAAQETDALKLASEGAPEAAALLAEALEGTQRISVWSGAHEGRPNSRADHVEYIYSSSQDLHTLFHMAARGGVVPAIWEAEYYAQSRMLARRCFDNHARDHGLSIDCDLIRKIDVGLVEAGFRHVVWLAWWLTRDDGDAQTRLTFRIDGVRVPLSALLAEYWPGLDRSPPAT